MNPDWLTPTDGLPDLERPVFLQLSAGDYTPTHWIGLPVGPNKKDQPRAGEMPHGSSAELS